MIFAKIAFWEIVSAKINLGLECLLLRRGSASARQPTRCARRQQGIAGQNAGTVALILSLLLTGCATHRQPRIAGRWQVSGMDNVVTLTKDHSARLTSRRRRVVK